MDVQVFQYQEHALLDLERLTVEGDSVVRNVTFNRMRNFLVFSFILQSAVVTVFTEITGSFFAESWKWKLLVLLVDQQKDLPDKVLSVDGMNS